MWHPENCGDISGYGFSLNTCNYQWNWSFDSTESYLAHVAICGLYGIMVWVAQEWVKSQGDSYKPPAIMEPIRKIHNLSLSAVSLWMAVVMIYTMFKAGRFQNIDTISCINIENSGLYGFANLVYLLSKIWEWADTLFLILSGKPVIFLHYFHHMTTFTMAAVVHNFPVGGYCFINCLVHFVMYLHYAYPVRWARPYITSGQLIQFVVVTSVHTYGYINSPSCYNMEPVKMEWFYCETVVLGYFFLFLNFFVQQYLKPPKKAPVEGKKKK